MSVRRTYNIGTLDLTFEWSPDKEAANLRKHGVGFFEAVGVFGDPNGVLIADPDHSDDDEDRYLLFGLGSVPQLLAVVHCYREDDSVIRIISVRKATRNEQRSYRQPEEP